MLEGDGQFGDDFTPRRRENFLILDEESSTVRSQLIVELQDVVTAYTNIGNVSQYRDAVKQGIPLHPAPYQTANRLAQEVSGPFHLTVSRSKMEAYVGVPRVASVLPHLGMPMPLVGIIFGTQDRAKPFQAGNPANQQRGGVAPAYQQCGGGGHPPNRADQPRAGGGRPPNRAEPRGAGAMGADLRDMGKAKGFLIWSPFVPCPCSDAGHASEGAHLCVVHLAWLLLCAGRPESLSFGTCEQFQADPRIWQVGLSGLRREDKRIGVCSGTGSSGYEEVITPRSRTTEVASL